MCCVSCNRATDTHSHTHTHAGQAGVKSITKRAIKSPKSQLALHFGGFSSPFRLSPDAGLSASFSPPTPSTLSSLQVSWVRHRDIHLLTVGRYTYTSDQRFEAMHSPHAEDWTLRIRYAQRKDSGIYECQISTTPPIGHSVYLNIVGEYL